MSNTTDRCICCGRRACAESEHEVAYVFCRVCGEDPHMGIAYLAARVARLEAKS